MYNVFFNLNEQPFNLTPDPKFIYLSPMHQEALMHMLYGVEEKKGFMLITGPIGTGKTTLTRALLEQVEGRADVALITNTLLNDMELLKAIITEFGLPVGRDGRQDQILVLKTFLFSQLEKKQNTVLIIDEAQNLAVPVLEMIRLLSNLETHDQKLLQIILIGQPELKKTLSRPDLAQLDQRITVRYHLRPLSFTDTVGYVKRRLTVAGQEQTAEFTMGALRLIQQYSGGIPRRINALGDRSLLVAFSKQSQTITKGHVRQASMELKGVVRTGLRNFLHRLNPFFLV